MRGSGGCSSPVAVWVFGPPGLFANPAHGQGRQVAIEVGRFTHSDALDFDSGGIVVCTPQLSRVWLGVRVEYNPAGGDGLVAEAWRPVGVQRGCE